MYIRYMHEMCIESKDKFDRFNLSNFATVDTLFADDIQNE